MTEQQCSYRQIMKATSLFGGLQVVKVLIAIVQSKINAFLFGPIGMGVARLQYFITGLGRSTDKDVADVSEFKIHDTRTMVRMRIMIIRYFLQKSGWILNLSWVSKWLL